MAELIQMLEGLNSMGCSCGGETRSRYAVRLAGFGASPQTVEVTSNPTPVPDDQNGGFVAKHEMGLKLVALGGLLVWWAKIRRDRRSYREGTRYLKTKAKVSGRRSHTGRTNSGKWLVEDL